jgi:hypothetical protein
MTSHSIIKTDIISQTQPLVYVMRTLNTHKLISIYLDLSSALKSLYLADESVILHVCFLNHTGKPCIDDNYDCSIGFFSADQENNVTYQRQLTKECEVVEDPSLLINPDDYQAIVDESEKSELPKQDHGAYHSNAIKMVDRAIITRFNQLSKLITGQYMAITYKMNAEYYLELEFDLVTESNQFYQESNARINQLNLDDKITMLKKISQLLERGQSEIETLKQLENDFTAEDNPSESVKSLVLEGPKNSFGTPPYIETDDPSWDQLGFDVDEQEQLELMAEFECNFNENHFNSNQSNPQTPNKSLKVLYASPTHKNHISKLNNDFKPKERDPNRPKKTVNFDLENTQTCVIEAENSFQPTNVGLKSEANMTNAKIFGIEFLQRENGDISHENGDNSRGDDIEDADSD